MKIRDIAPFGLRIPSDLKERLRKAGKERRYSLNKEMVTRLDESFRPRLELSDISDGELVAELMRRYERGTIYIRIGGPIDEDMET